MNMHALKAEPDAVVEAPVVATDDSPDRLCEGIQEFIPDDPNKPYNIREIVTAIADENYFYELHDDFAPNIVTFLDADNLWEINLRIGYEVLPSAIAYISYQNVRVNFSLFEDEEVVERGGQLGLELRF